MRTRAAAISKRARKRPGETMCKEQTTIRIDAELRSKIQREADRRDISFNEMVNLLICKGMELVNQSLL
jgi:predicted HicB family RNase H-like nuclease